MTTNDIDAIRQREHAATEGPWPLITDACGCNGEYPCGHGDYPIGFGPFYSVEHTGTERAHADHEFAAHARTDVPALLAKVDELTAWLADERRERAESEAWGRQLRSALTKAQNERNAATREMEKLRAVVDAAKAWRWSGDTADGHRRAEAALMAAVDALPTEEDV